MKVSKIKDWLKSKQNIGFEVVTVAKPVCVYQDGKSREPNQSDEDWIVTVKRLADSKTFTLGQKVTDKTGPDLPSDTRIIEFKKNYIDVELSIAPPTELLLQSQIDLGINVFIKVVSIDDLV